MGHDYPYPDDNWAGKNPARPKETRHLLFVLVPPKRKRRTSVWWVVNKHDDIQLGWIGWHTGWCKYAFYPRVETVFEQVCLRDIADFCEQMTKEHKNGVKALA
jgi:hypothetical protein